MKNSLIAIAIISYTTLAFAGDAPGTMSMIVDGNSVLKFVIPQNSDGGLIGCYSTGNTAAANQFIAKYGSQDVIWADQINTTSAHGGSMTYEARLSASVGGTWIHQHYQMNATYEHRCYVSARLTGESKD